jgi:uncharacterized protein YdeI (YjbR/CyaY-like superfamily)
VVPPDLQAALDKAPKAAIVFAAMTRTQRYAIIIRLGAIKRAETRSRIIADCIT